MLMLEAVFWVCAGLILYPYLLYPLLLAAWAWLRPRPIQRGMNGPRSVSFVICLHNERDNIDRRLHELIGVLDATGIQGEVIVVSDGSTDDTVAVARRHDTPRVRVLELPRRLGKAEALTQGVATAKNPIVVLADARQTWAPEALELLLENFADPTVGAVSGDLVVVSGGGVMAGVGLYWRHEKWLRRQESLAGSQVGVTGAISAVRRELFRPIPAGTLLDDVYWPLNVALQGYRVVHDHRALAYDRLPKRPRDEFRRKVRTLAGNFQLLVRLPAALIPGRSPVWLQFLSHKLARLIAPWALLGLLGCSMALDGRFYLAVLLAQAFAYSLAVVGLTTRRGGQAAAAAATFLVLNAAAWAAFWVWVSGREGRSWQKVSYDYKQTPVPGAPTPVNNAAREPAAAAP